jgi:hypothetical protein
MGWLQSGWLVWVYSYGKGATEDESASITPVEARRANFHTQIV